MKIPYWLSAVAPCFVSKELPSYRFSKPSAWQSRHLCLRSPMVGKVRLCGLLNHLQERVERVDKKTPTGPWRALANLAGKAAAALPGIIGLIVSWLSSTLGKTATWLAETLWALAIAVGTLLLVAARDWLAR